MQQKISCESSETSESCESVVSGKVSVCGCVRICVDACVVRVYELLFMFCVYICVDICVDICVSHLCILCVCVVHEYAADVYVCVRDHMMMMCE